MKAPLYLIFGPPGSGKSLVADYLAHQLHLRHVSWGALTRDPNFRKRNSRQFAVIENPKTTAALRAKTISSLIRPTITRGPGESERPTGLILEGFPQNMREARELDRIVRDSHYAFRALVRINPSFEAVTRRLSSRRTCSRCHQYFLPFNLEPMAAVCPHDGGELVGQPYDQRESRDEFLSYSRDIQQVCSWLSRKADINFDVSGDDDEITIASNIIGRLGHSTKKFPGTYVRQGSARLPTKHGVFTVVTFQSKLDYSFHLALVKGRVRGRDDVVVRLHSSCITGEIFSSEKCECGEQLDAALKRVNQEGTGILVYLFQEGRGINIINKVRAYRLQDRGLDTVDANEALGLPAELREYSACRDILESLGVRSVVLLTNNPDKVQKLTDLGITVSGRQSLEVAAKAANKAYLQTKKDRMGHRLDALAVGAIIKPIRKPKKSRN